MQVTVKGMNIKVTSGEDGFVTLDSDGSITIIAAAPVSLTAPSIIITGDLNVAGNITATGNIMDGGSNTNHHSH